MELTVRNERAAAALALISLVAASGPARSDAVAEAWTALEGRLAECSAETGLAESELGLAEDALAPGERAWRACAYAAIETLVIPRTRIPDAYRRLITEDRILTDLIEQGKVTRSQRRTRLDKLVAELERGEAAARRPQGGKSPAGQGPAGQGLAGMRDELVLRQDEMRRMREIQSMMAR